MKSARSMARRWGRRALLAPVVGVYATAIACSSGCSSSLQEPACHGVTASQIEAEFIASVTALKVSGACDEYAKPSEQCPQYVELERQFERDLKEFEECP